MTEADFDSDKEIQLARWIQKNLRDDWNVIDVFVYADGTVSTKDISSLDKSKQTKLPNPK